MTTKPSTTSKTHAASKQGREHVPAPAQAGEQDTASDHSPKRLTNPNEKILGVFSLASLDYERLEMLIYALALTQGDKLAKDLQEHFQVRWSVAPGPGTTPGSATP